MTRMQKLYKETLQNVQTSGCGKCLATCNPKNPSSRFDAGRNELAGVGNVPDVGVSSKIPEKFSMSMPLPSMEDIHILHYVGGYVYESLQSTLL